MCVFVTERLFKCVFLQGDHISVVRLLLQFGASYSIFNKYSLTPVDIAERLGRPEMTKLYSGFVKS